MISISEESITSDTNLSGTLLWQISLVQGHNHACLDSFLRRLSIAEAYFQELWVITQSFLRKSFNHSLCLQNVLLQSCRCSITTHGLQCCKLILSPRQFLFSTSIWDTQIMDFLPSLIMIRMEIASFCPVHFFSDGWNMLKKSLISPLYKGG